MKMRWIFAYVIAGIVFGLMDAVWLSWAGPNLYQPVIGDIMAEEFNFPAAMAFYLIYIAGMVWFAIRPAVQSGNVQAATLNGALLGGLCYATFDLTSQAVFIVWATHVSIMDIAWGAFVTATASTLSAFAVLRMKPS
jgi:uncharacterized membrane protein